MVRAAVRAEPRSGARGGPATPPAAGTALAPGARRWKFGGGGARYGAMDRASQS